MPLTTQEIEKRLYTDRDLIVSPILDREKQISNGAVDIRLGQHFIALRSTNLVALNPADVHAQRQVGQAQVRVYIPFGQYIVLQPNTIVLGTALEFVGLPNDLHASVITRSSYGRLGLTIATAVSVHAGYKGCLTLELVNHGKTAIQLSPGCRIGHLEFSQLSSADRKPYSALGDGAKYVYPTLPEFSKIHEEHSELEMFAQIGKAIAGC